MTVDLSTLNGTNGFRIDGIDLNDLSGFSVSNAGDVNNDGIDDIIIGARFGDPDGTGNAGESYIVFGKMGGFASSLDLSALNGTNGFRIDGVDITDNSGESVSGAGDVNGDGIDDIIIGAPDVSASDRDGSAYVVFGTDGGFAATFDLSSLNGANGLPITSGGPLEDLGAAVSSAGDFNGDGIADVIIGAPNADVDSSSGFNFSGRAYIVLGNTPALGSSIDLRFQPARVIILEGINTLDEFGFSVSSAGDINGDGLDDVIVGAYGADGNGRSDSGETFVVFGSSLTTGRTIDVSTLNGTTGFRLDGIDADDESGYSVSSAGDINGDGIDDIVIGAPLGGTTGEAYVVFGKPLDLLPA